MCTGADKGKEDDRMLILDHTISKRIENPDMRLLSLGAGVQSSVMALLAERGEFGDMPNVAVFSDTQWEPQAVYDHLDWLEDQLSFPVFRVTAGSILESIKAATQPLETKRFATIPWYMGTGMGRRQCTREFKIAPIRRKQRELLGLKPHQRAAGKVIETWIGISTDEAERMKLSREAWAVNRWPLIEAGWNRNKCRLWFAEEYPGRNLPKSSCIGCPYHNDAHWADMQTNDPESFASAVNIDHMLRMNGATRGMKNLQYMHRSCKPLSEVDFGVDSGQMDFGFLEECEGMCGV